MLRLFFLDKCVTHEIYLTVLRDHVLHQLKSLAEWCQQDGINDYVTSCKRLT